MTYMWLQIHRRYNAVFDENKKLKEDQTVLLTSLNTREERVKELEKKVAEVQEEKGVKVLEDKDDKALGKKDDKGLEDSRKKPNEMIETQQSKCIESLDKATHIHSVDANVSNFIMNQLHTYVRIYSYDYQKIYLFINTQGQRKLFIISQTNLDSENYLIKCVGC